jgi:large subunit ribosomal protein L22
MEIKAKVKYIKSSPRKTRLVVDLIRGLQVEEALNQLTVSNKTVAKPVIKLVKSAIANAVNNYELEESNLFVKMVKVDDGPTLHRWMPRARGRATPIRKRTSHIEIILGELKDSGVKAAKKQEIEAPVKLDTTTEEAPKEEKKPTTKKKATKKETTESTEEKGKKIVDPRGEGKGKNTKIEGKNEKAFGGKIFRRKAG